MHPLISLKDQNLLIKYDIKVEYSNEKQIGIFTYDNRQFEVSILNKEHFKLGSEQYLQVAQKIAVILIKKDLLKAKAGSKPLIADVDKQGIGLSDNSFYSHDKPKKTRKDYDALANYVLGTTAKSDSEEKYSSESVSDSEKEEYSNSSNISTNSNSTDLFLRVRESNLKRKSKKLDKINITKPKNKTQQTQSRNTSNLFRKDPSNYDSSTDTDEKYIELTKRSKSSNNSVAINKRQKKSENSDLEIDSISQSDETSYTSHDKYKIPNLKKEEFRSEDNLLSCFPQFENEANPSKDESSSSENKFKSFSDIDEPSDFHSLANSKHDIDDASSDYATCSNDEASSGYESFSNDEVSSSYATTSFNDEASSTINYIEDSSEVSPQLEKLRQMFNQMEELKHEARKQEARAKKQVKVEN